MNEVNVGDEDGLYFDAVEKLQRESYLRNPSHCSSKSGSDDSEDGVDENGELIDENSGGHKCITNISGLNYYGRSRRKPRSKGGYDRGEDDAPYVALTKNIQKKFVDLLKKEINTKS